MVPATDLGPWYALRTSNRSLDSLAVLPRILNGGYSRFDLAEHHRDLGRVDNAHRVLTILLQPVNSLPSIFLRWRLLG